jgi:hypothetical protein
VRRRLAAAGFSFSRYDFYDCVSRHASSCKLAEYPSEDSAHALAGGASTNPATNPALLDRVHVTHETSSPPPPRSPSTDVIQPPSQGSSHQQRFGGLGLLPPA